MSARKFSLVKDDGISDNEARKHRIVDGIDAGTMTLLKNILLPDAQQTTLHKLSSEQSELLTERLGRVIDVVMRIEEDEKQPYDADKLPGALLATAAKWIERYQRLRLDKSKSGQSIH